MNIVIHLRVPFLRSSCRRVSRYVPRSRQNPAAASRPVTGTGTGPLCSTRRKFPADPRLRPPGRSRRAPLRRARVAPPPGAAAFARAVPASHRPALRLSSLTTAEREYVNVSSNVALRGSRIFRPSSKAGRHDFAELASARRRWTRSRGVACQRLRSMWNGGDWPAAPELSPPGASDQDAYPEGEPLLETSRSRRRCRPRRRVSSRACPPAVASRGREPRTIAGTIAVARASLPRGGARGVALLLLSHVRSAQAAATRPLATRSERARGYDNRRNMFFSTSHGPRWARSSLPASIACWRIASGSPRPTVKP